MQTVLSELGADVSVILRSAGLPQDLFSKPEASVRLEEVDRLLTHCKRETARDDIGFRVGELSSAAVIGIVGLVSVNCDTVREAWKTIADGLKTSDTLGHVTFSAFGGKRMSAMNWSRATSRTPNTSRIARSPPSST